MRFEEQIQVPVPLAEVWDFLWQTQRLAACLPGCKSVEEVEAGERYKVLFEDQVGPYKIHFDLNIKVQETRPQQLVRLLCEGQDKRLGASQKTTLEVGLREAEGQTSLDIVADMLILGKLATLGQFLIKRKANDVVKQFARNVQTALQPQPAGGTNA